MWFLPFGVGKRSVSGEDAEGRWLSQPQIPQRWDLKHTQDDPCLLRCTITAALNEQALCIPSCNAPGAAVHGMEPVFTGAARWAGNEGPAGAGGAAGLGRAFSVWDALFPKSSLTKRGKENKIGCPPWISPGQRGWS